LSVENLVTDHIETWTTAQVPKKSGGRGRGKKTNGQTLYGIKKLRELILELGVRGKLVPQEPKDEPAYELLKKIAKEKARLVKEGKIKKQKPLPEIGEDEKPYELPQGWAWSRLGRILDVQDSIRVPINNAERQSRIGPYPYYGANGQVGVIDDFLFEGERILLAEDGGFFSDPIRGVSYIVNGKFWVNNHAHVMECLCGTAASFWTSYFNRMNWEPLVQGMTRAKLNQRTMLDIPLPTPPLDEQHRIVAKVDELMALCDKLEQEQTNNSETHQQLVKTLLDTLTNATDHEDFIESWQRIEGNFDILFTTPESIDVLKQTVLQLAVMGKLVPQDPDDEPASVLLERIADEKDRLVEEGKLKKQKPLPVIREDEKLFELPDGWEWTRLIDYYDVRDGTHDSPKATPEGYPLITSKNLYSGKLDFENVTYISTEDHLKIIERSNVNKGDILFAMIGSIGNPVIVDTEKAFSIKNVALFKYYSVPNSVPSFLLIYLQHSSSGMKAEATGAVQSFVSLGKLRSYIKAVPPLQEQHRIVAKVDELMAICDSLKDRLNDAQITQVQLADAIVANAVDSHV
jgi:type I restriction enzyme, S subunit